MSMQVLVPYADFHCFRYLPRSAVAGSNGTLLLVFRERSTLISTVSVPIYISTSSLEGFAPFSLHAFQPYGLVVFLMLVSHSDWGEVESKRSFDLYFLNG